MVCIWQQVCIQEVLCCPTLVEYHVVSDHLHMPGQAFFCHSEFLHHMPMNSPIVYALSVSDILSATVGHSLLTVSTFFYQELTSVMSFCSSETNIFTQCH